MWLHGLQFDLGTLGGPNRVCVVEPGSIKTPFYAAERKARSMKEYAPGAPIRSEDELLAEGQLLADEERPTPRNRLDPNQRQLKE